MGRVVFLVDMNAFFISCETTRRPELRGKPAAVAGDPKKRSGIILTANYEARAYGVRTTMTIYEAQRRCPEIILLPGDMRFYSQMSHRVMEIFGQFTPVVEQNSIDEAWLDMTGSSGLFGKPSLAAQKIMGEIMEKLGLYCSIGISENKFLSKMAADMKKPQGITELWQRDIEKKLWPLPVGAMYGIGSHTAAHLARIGMSKIGDIALYGKDILPARLGKYGRSIFLLANGIDPEPVTPRRQNAMKSIGRSTTMPQDVTEFDDARRILFALAEEVGADARRHGKKGTTVGITLKFPDFSNITRQAPVDPTFLTKEIYKAAAALLEKNWTGRPVRLIGLSISGFESDAPSQLSFFADSAVRSGKKEEHLEKTVDKIRQRFGVKTIKRASLLNEKYEGRHH